MNLKFFIPLNYSFLTRINKIETKISYIYNYVLPVFILFFYISNFSIRNNLIIFIFSFLALNIVYEIGYIYNDVYTVKYEKNPTVRLNNEEDIVLNKIYPLMISMRILIVIIIFIILNNLNIRTINIFVFLIFLGLLNMIYSFHNYFRNNKNIITMFFLMLFKYLSVPILVVDSTNNILILFVFLLTIPLVRTLLYTTHDRISFNFIKKDKINLFRVKFYGIEILLSLVIGIFLKKGYFLTFFSLYFFMFYLIALLSFDRKNKK